MHREQTWIKAALRWVTGAVLCCGLWWSASLAQAAPRYAVFVGSNKAPPGLTPLRFAHEDARKVRDAFVELGGVEPSRALLLLDPGADEVREALRSLRSRAGAERLLFYYSGHADASGLLLGTQRMPLSEIRAFLADDSSQTRLAVIDACNSGAISRVKGGTLEPGVDIRWSAEPDTRGAVLITSSAAEESSIERDDLGGSLFTHFLVSGLRGAADTDSNSRVTLEEAFQYASTRTLDRSTRSRVGTQHPTYEYQLAGQQQIVLTWLEQPSHITFGDKLTGAYLVFDRTRGQVVAEIDKKPGRTQRLWLPPGDYYVKKRLPSSILLQKIDLAKGSHHELREHEMHTVPYEEDVTKGYRSEVFQPTWTYGAPYVRYTAHTLRRGEKSVGIALASIGISDEVMLGTVSAFNLILTPNLLTKVRLAQWSDFTWSLETVLLQSYIERVLDKKKRSTIVLETTTMLSWNPSPPLTLTAMATWGTDSMPDVGPDRLDLEVQRLRASASLTLAVTEQDLLQVLLEENFAYYTGRATWDLGGRAFYAHAWGSFRLGVGLARDPFLLGRLATRSYFYPILDAWWRW